MRTKMKNKTNVSKFQKTSRTLDKLYPPNEKFSQLRKRFRELFLVSEENGRNCFTPKGNAGYIFEKDRHLTRYFYMIHPYSKFRQYWETILLIEIYMGLFLRSLFVSQVPELIYSLAYQLPSLIADLLETCDMFMLLVVGYIDKETREVMLEYRKVVLHNLLNVYFYALLFVSLPLDFISYTSHICGLGAFPSAFRYIVFIKIFKVFTFTKYYRHMAKIHTWSEKLSVTVWSFAFIFIICHWLTCMFLTVLHHENRTKNFDYYILQHSKIFCIIFSIVFDKNGFFSKLVISSVTEKLFWFFTVVIVNFSNILVLGLLIQFYGLVKSSDIYYDEMIQEVQKFLVQENLPKHMHTKVMKYFEFRFGYKYFVEKTIIATLSPPMQREIANFLCLPLLIHPKSVFNGIPSKMASDLCLALSFEIFFPGDVIFRAGEFPTKMFFLYSGSVVVFSSKGKEVMHFYEGQQFGTSSFVAHTLHPVTVIALEMSEVYILKFTDFLKISAESPEYIGMVCKAASDRRKYILGLYNED